MPRPKIIIPRKLFLILAIAWMAACQQYEAPPETQTDSGQKITQTVTHPEWSRNLAIYEVNLRQYSPGGTFKEFEQHLPRLQKMGIGLIWLMPIHPIGQKNRKGSMGSYYAVQDYLAVSKDHGTLGDLKSLVKKIHEMGMYVIIDWVANHTAWDNVLTIEHPEWFTKDQDGNFIPPVSDWYDVIDLNFDHPGLREYMIKALKYWVKETDIDGYRCDVAGMVPMDFWNSARRELDKIKPVFMLAEAEGGQYHQQAFDMTYAWELHHLFNDVAKGKKTVADFDTYFQKSAEGPRDAYHMQFISNHDENSWNGTVFERLGESAKCFAVFSAVIKGMPLVYCGQESGLNKRLNFFEKDVIEWKDHEFAGLYATLFNLKKKNRALWNGESGGEMRRVNTSNDEAVFSFVREKDQDKILAVFNFSGSLQVFSLKGKEFRGEYRDVFTNDPITFSEGAQMELGPWGYKVFKR